MNIKNLAERPLLHSPHERDIQPRYEHRGGMDYSVLNNTWNENYQDQGGMKSLTCQQEKTQ